MNDPFFIKQLSSKYQDHLRRVILGIPYDPILLRGGKQKPESTTALHSAVESFQKYEKKADRPGWTIEWKAWKTRKLGNQLWPESVTVETEEDLLFLLDKQEELSRFRSLVDQLLSWNPAIRPWLAEVPLRVLEHGVAWPAIRLVIDFFLRHDVSAYYIRSLPIPVHSKFIEQNELIIYSLLSFLSPERFPKTARRLDEAAGLRQLPFLYPIRWLDKMLSQQYAAGLDILALPYLTLQKSNWIIPEVWIVENQTNLYLLPERKNALAVFVKGKALHNLQNMPFLRKAKIFYWGDLDEDGFEMLDSFRQYYPQTVSVLMDERTVVYHRQFIHPVPFRRNRTEMTLFPLEKAAYLLLWRHQGRIEQEKLEQLFVQQYIKQINP